MKTNTCLALAPLAAAMLLGGSLLAGCQRDDTSAATQTTAAADTAGTNSAGTPTTPVDSDMNGVPDANEVPADSTMADATGSSMPAGAMSSDMPTSGPISDSQFYQQALTGGRKEVALSQMASRQSDDADVKRVADMLVRDHTAMNQKLEAAAGSAAPPASAADATDASLQGKTGDAFDRAYIDKMVSDHEKTIAMFENAASNADSDAAKKLASDALPKLREHLSAVQQLQQDNGS